MIKVKYRLFIAILGLVVVVGFVGIMELTGLQQSSTTQYRRVQSSGAFYVDRLAAAEAARRTKDTRLSDRQVPPHLAIMRKDLDVSNYRSPEVKGSDSKLLQYVLQDDDIRRKDNVNNIIRIANLVDKFRKQSPTNSDRSPSVARPAHDANIAPPSNVNSLDLIAIRRRLREIELNEIKQTNKKFLLTNAEVTALKNIVSKLSRDAKKAEQAPPINIYKGSRLPAWRLFHNHITQHQLYDGPDPAIDRMLNDITTTLPVKLYQHEGGTQLKLVLTYPNHGRAMWKPRRFPRDRETLPDHFYFSDYERFNAEIAAFRLDRVLGFHRVPPTAGRLLNITKDIEPLASEKLAKTFFYSPAGNVCFHGKCSYYCDSGHAVCGNPYMIEGSVAAYLPSNNDVSRKTWRHPWRRSYSKHRDANWEVEDDYCDDVRTRPPYNLPRRLLDLMDMAVFDFLTGNMDRHHYETFQMFGNYTFPLLMDNGRAFGKSKKDEMTILAPIRQCCLIRYSTLAKLAKFSDGKLLLSDLLRDELRKDKLPEIVTEPHLLALDRRVNIILRIVLKCTRKKGVMEVVKDDGF